MTLRTKHKKKCTKCRQCNYKNVWIKEARPTKRSTDRPTDRPNRSKQKPNEGLFGICANQLSSDFCFAHSWSLFNCGTKPIKINWIYCIRWKCYVIWRPRCTRKKTNNSNTKQPPRWYDTSMVGFTRERNTMLCSFVLSPLFIFLFAVVVAAKRQFKLGLCFVVCIHVFGRVVCFDRAHTMLPHWKSGIAGALTSTSLFLLPGSFFVCLY